MFSRRRKTRFSRIRGSPKRNSAGLLCHVLVLLLAACFYSCQKINAESLCSTSNSNQEPNFAIQLQQGKRNQRKSIHLNGTVFSASSLSFAGSIHSFRTDSPLESSRIELVPQVQASVFESSYRLAWRLVKENTMFPERLAQWNQWEHRFDGKLNTTKDFEEALNSMLSSLSDQYTYFRNLEETQSSHKHDVDYSIVSRNILPRKIAYIAIRSFSSVHTADQFESALLQIEKNTEGLVLDLRGNHGGYVEQARACFELLSDEGKFVSMKGREDDQPYNETLLLEKNCLKRVLNGVTYCESRRKNLTGKIAVVVLVDENTRSAAEMIAGALKDTQRATIAGTRTFGKGIVQCSWSLEPGCSIKIAMAKYYLPSGADINGIGIIPDTYIDFGKTELSSILRSLFPTSLPHQISASVERSQ